MSTVMKKNPDQIVFGGSCSSETGTYFFLVQPILLVGWAALSPFDFIY